MAIISIVAYSASFIMKYSTELKWCKRDVGILVCFPCRNSVYPYGVLFCRPPEWKPILSTASAHFQTVGWSMWSTYLRYATIWFGKLICYIRQSKQRPLFSEQNYGNLDRNRRILFSELTLIHIPLYYAAPRTREVCWERICTVTF
jgi:hypothetical protein